VVDTTVAPDLSGFRFEEEIRIIVRLQRISAAVRKDRHFRVWELD
jgi:hypothetical protein